MPYIVTPLAASVKQISFDDILNDTVNLDAILRSRARVSHNTATRTYYYPDDIPVQYYRDLDLGRMIASVREFNRKTEYLHRQERKSLYEEFRIPKASGGWRKIDAPVDNLKKALRELKEIFEEIYRPLYHTAAFAYIKKRSAIDAVKKHQQNGSWWFLKTDFSDFFGSTTPEFTLRMLEQIFPFSEVLKSPEGRAELERALDLCFLSGGLPQGTPMSPFLTNVLMIPIDFRFANALWNNNGDRWGGNHFVYTRYADDIDISCKGSFDWKNVLAYMRATLHEFGAPYQIKQEKTHYGSRNGRNWILGVMLNKDNQISIGHKKKKQYRSCVHNFATKRDEWTLEDVQYAIGLTSYYRNVEPSYVDKMIDECRRKYGFDYDQVMKEVVAGWGRQTEQTSGFETPFV